VDHLSRGREDAERVTREIRSAGFKCSFLRFDATAPEELVGQFETTCKPNQLYFFATPPISLETGDWFSPDIIGWDFMRFRKKRINHQRLLKMRLTDCYRTSQNQLFGDSQLLAYDRLQVTCVLLSPESSLTPFQRAKGSGRRTALASRIALLDSLVFACPDRHGRSMVSGHDVAV
jgi:hypothetical protein